MQTRKWRLSFDIVCHWNICCGNQTWYLWFKREKERERERKRENACFWIDTWVIVLTLYTSRCASSSRWNYTFRCVYNEPLSFVRRHGNRGSVYCSVWFVVSCANTAYICPWYELWQIRQECRRTSRNSNYCIHKWYIDILKKYIGIKFILKW